MMFTVLYLLLIVALVLFSWVGSIYGLLLPDGTMLPNILSEESVRWFVRHSIDNIAAAPFVEILLVLISISALRSSRFMAAAFHQKQLTRRHRYALRTSLVVFAVCLCALLLGIAPGGNLLSVTGHIAGGPFSSGWLFLLAVVICLPCIIYGRMSGQWHTEKEILVGLSAEIVRCADCFVTCIVASQLVATMRYVCLFDLLGWSDTLITLTETIVYALPFIWRWLMSSGVHRIS